MTQWSIQRNLSMNKSIESPHILTAHNTNTPSRNSTPIVDDSLTNLSWLHDINILKRTIPTINSSSSRKEQNLSNPSISGVYPNDIDDDNDLIINNDDQWKIYKTNPQIKPVYSYSQLILLAMKKSGQDKMTLQMIYEWIAENFPYFRKMEPTWQNSIRHNLSLNKCFIKVPRTKKQAGSKGGFWKLSPDYQKQSLGNNQQEQQLNTSSNKRKRIKNIIKTESWIDPILPSMISKHPSYVRMPSSFLSPISSPDSLTVPPFYHQQQQINEFSSILTPSPSSSPSSMSSVISKQNFISTKLDDTDMLLLDSVTFDWDAYLCEDVQPLLSNKTEQDLFNDFNAALSDLTYSAETAAAGGDPSAFDGFDYSTKNSTFNSLFENNDEQQPQPLTIKGRGIKRPSWWMTNECVSTTTTKLPSLETAFDLKLSK